MLRRFTRPLRHGLLYVAFQIFRGIVALTPRPLALAAAAALARVAYAAGGRTRAGATRRIGDVLGLGRGEAARICRRMYRHFALSLVDVMIFGGWRRRRLARVIEVEGFDYVERAMAEGRGVVGITGHFSNWELLGGYVAARLGGIAVLATTAYDKNFDRMLARYRRRLGVRTVYRTEPAAVPLRWLAGGGFLGALADQDVPALPSVTVDFMGRPARTPVGPALLARRARAPLIPMYITREEDNDYRVVVEAPLAKSAAAKVKDAVREDTAGWSEAVGRWVRRHPEQWAWVHERWRADRLSGPDV
jgi:KDO2-lipid IV(A) lauroyltransferase